MEDDDAADAADDGETFLVELTTRLQLLRKMPERSIWGLFARERSDALPFFWLYWWQYWNSVVDGIVYGMIATAIIFVIVTWVN